MKRFFCKILSAALCFAVVLSMLIGFGCEGSAQLSQEELKEKAPDYSSSDLSLHMYAHVGPTNGHYTDVTGQAQFTGEDYRTVERYQEYKDMGEETLLLLGNDPYMGEDFATSQLKKNLDMAAEVGLRVIVFDLRVHDLSSNMSNTGEQLESLVGSGYQFATQEDLEAHIATLIAPYKDHPAFYGVTLFDEPTYVKLKSVGQVYRALKTLVPDIYIPVVLLPFMDESGWIYAYSGQNAVAGNTVPLNAYKKYVEKYFEETQATNLLYDDYPFRLQANIDDSQYIRTTYLQNLQIMSEYANEHNANLEICIQAFSMTSGLRKVSEEDIRWQINTALSFGVDNIIHYTYWMFPNQTGPGYGGEGANSAIMDNYGNKLLYNEVKRVNAESQNLAKVILNFDYQKSYYDFTSLTPPRYFLGLKDVQELDGITDIEVTETTLINQMYDDEKQLRGYMVQNLTDPYYETEDSVKLTFDTDYKYLMMINKGQTTYAQLDENNAYTFELECGDGCFVIPYN